MVYDNKIAIAIKRCFHCFLGAFLLDEFHLFRVRSDVVIYFFSGSGDILNSKFAAKVRYSGGWPTIHHPLKSQLQQSIRFPTFQDRYVDL